jgi:hypothetical protein
MNLRQFVGTLSGLPGAGLRQESFQAPFLRAADSATSQDVVAVPACRLLANAAEFLSAGAVGLRGFGNKIRRRHNNR